MKLKDCTILGASLVVLLGLSGCAHYGARPLNRLSGGVLSNKKEQFVSFKHRVFSKRDCKKYLDRNVISKGYQPVNIELTNNSNRCLDISTKRFSFPCVPAEEVASKVHTSTTNRAVGYGVAGLFVWPLLIPAVVDGVGSSNANKQLDEDFAQKELRDQIVGPYSRINALIFVPKEDFDKHFSFTVVDRQNGEKFVLSPGSPRLSA